MDRPESGLPNRSIPVEDFKFLMKTELLQATPDTWKRRVIESMTRLRIEAGRKFISQGEKGDCLYVIQEGFCVVSVDKDGQSYPLSRLRPGDIVGEVAVLTGERRSADANAQTDMVLWAMPADELESICSECTELHEFLMDLATERLCSQKITAERAIGRYVINEILAEGGWSIVYKGCHSFLNLPVAIKMLKHNMARDSDLMGRFMNEAKIIAGLNHENIVKVHDIEHVHRTVFIVMEYLEGVTLRHILKNKLRLPFPRTLQILLQVCSGLDYAHRKGIVHQDVKPGNIFIEKSDRVKVVDFGLASPIGGCSHELPGTAFYMAPEQIEGEPVDPRSDIYSLGITAFEMATGQRPYPDDVCEVLKAHITQPTPDPRTLNPDLPEPFCNFIAKATQKDPAARYARLGEVRAELESMLENTLESAARPRGKQVRRMMSLFMFYNDEHQVELSRLTENFGERIRELGAELRVANFEDV